MHNASIYCVAVCVMARTNNSRHSHGRILTFAHNVGDGLCERGLFAAFAHGTMLLLRIPVTCVIDSCGVIGNRPLLFGVSRCGRWARFWKSIPIRLWNRRRCRFRDTDRPNRWGGWWLLCNLGDALYLRGSSVGFSVRMSLFIYGRRSLLKYVCNTMRYVYLKQSPSHIFPNLLYFLDPHFKREVNSWVTCSGVRLSAFF